MYQNRVEKCLHNVQIIVKYLEYSTNTACMFNKEYLVYTFDLCMFVYGNVWSYRTTIIRTLCGYFFTIVVHE